MIYRFNQRTSPEMYGLKYFPELVAPVDNNSDAGDWGDKEDLSTYNGDLTHFTPASANALISGLHWVDKISSILEIGVHRAGPDDETSSTKILLRSKSEDAIYLGVDIEDKHFLDNPVKHVYTLQCNSGDNQAIYTQMNELSITSFDFIFIDGWHSVNQVVFEWAHYVTKLNIGGVVGFHDTNYHPGPRLVFDAIDETYFEKRKCCTVSTEFGIGLAKRIK